MAGRACGDALPRPHTGSTGRALHRLPHRHPGGGPGAGLRALPPGPVPDDLLLQGLGPRGLRGPGPAVRPAGGRLRLAAAEDPAPRSRELARARGDRDRLPGGTRDRGRPRAGAAYQDHAARSGFRRTAFRASRGRGRELGPGAHPWLRVPRPRDRSRHEWASGCVGRPLARFKAEPRLCRHDAELLFTFVLGGAATLQCEGRDEDRLAAGDSFVVPAGLGHRLRECSEDLELLEVFLPARFATILHPAEGSKDGISRP